MTHKDEILTFLSNKKCTQSCEKELMVKEKLSARMFDPGVVMVPSAGRPAAVPLWVPALNTSCFRESRGGVGDGELFAVMQKID